VQPFPGRGIFYFVRHGETEWNREGRVMGRLAVPLSDDGRRQVRDLIPMLVELEARVVWTSPLPRARETAEEIAAGLGGLPVHLEADLTEVDYGDWAGRTFAEIVGDPAYQDYVRDPDHSGAPGRREGLSQVRDRICSALGRIARTTGGAPALVVSHGDPIRLALGACLGLDLGEVRRLRVDNGAVSAVELTGDWAEVKFVNVRPDLGGILRASRRSAPRQRSE
jgi:ribonuclease H / adenosylcobalamin/alpha-ribazole phosphatase